jgi:sugar-specific transcriptional regulator TrmB
MDVDVLKKTGLTDNEITIYIFLLKRGETTTGPIIKETKIANSRVYESLNTLIDRGLVSYNIQKNGKHFKAESPHKIMALEQEKIKQLEQKLPELINIQKLQQTQTTSAVYEGFEGFRTAFKKIIEDCRENETIYVLGFSEQTYATISLRTFLKNMNLKSAEKNQKLKIILDETTKKTLGKDRSKEPNTTIKYMPKGYVSPAAIDVFQDYVYIFLWEEKPYVFMIKNQTIANSFKQYFEFLWMLAK